MWISRNFSSYSITGSMTVSWRPLHGDRYASSGFFRLALGSLLGISFSSASLRCVDLLRKGIAVEEFQVEASRFSEWSLLFFSDFFYSFFLRSIVDMLFLILALRLILPDSKLVDLYVSCLIFSCGDLYVNLALRDGDRIPVVFLMFVGVLFLTEVGATFLRFVGVSTGTFLKIRS